MSLASKGELIAPAGMYRVVGVDTFNGPTVDYLIGDFPDKKQAVATAKRRGGDMNPVYVYDDEGRLVASFGRP